MLKNQKCMRQRFRVQRGLLLPEGESTIARQFTAGSKVAFAQVPKGRLNDSRTDGFNRPFGT